MEKLSATAQNLEEINMDKLDYVSFFFLSKKHGKKHQQSKKKTKGDVGKCIYNISQIHN